MKLSQTHIRELIKESKNHSCEPASCCVQLVAIADLPSQFGEFQICGFVSPCDGKDHTAIIKGNILDKESVVMRLHSECLTGDIMGSKRCDCRDQLLESLKYIEAEGQGILLYLRQEGRGIGLSEKIRAYAIQDLGVDTVDANLILGYQPDERDYGVAAHILRTLRVRSIKLLTNNPEKIEQLARYGVKVVERLPMIIKPTEYNRAYLETKTEKSGHLLGNLADIRDVDEVRSLAKRSKDVK